MYGYELPNFGVLATDPGAVDSEEPIWFPQVGQLLRRTPTELAAARLQARSTRGPLRFQRYRENAPTFAGVRNAGSSSSAPEASQITTTAGPLAAPSAESDRVGPETKTGQWRLNCYAPTILPEHEVPRNRFAVIRDTAALWLR
jgi:hypothetical protein